jgi:hypothetical protein
MLRRKIALKDLIRLGKGITEEMPYIIITVTANAALACRQYP